MGLFDDQADPQALRDLVQSDRVEMALCLFMDFADAPLYLCSRTVGFTDANGQRWTAGGGLLVAIPSLDFSEANLAPERQYILGIREDQTTIANWRSILISSVDDVANYQGREYSLQVQFFDNGFPVGTPVYIDRGRISRQELSFSTDITALMVLCEAGAARVNVASGLLLTNADQKSLYPTDRGLEFAVENNKDIVWTQF